MKTYEPNPAHKPERHSTLSVLIGLAVIWVALFIVFKANQLSTIRVQVARPNLSIEPRARLMLPATVHLPNLSRRQAIKRLASEIDLRVADSELTAIENDKIIDRNLSGTIVRIIHQLIGNSNVGIVLSGDRMHLVSQELRYSSAGATEWHADAVVMDSPEIGIAPLPDPPLWFTLRLSGTAAQPLAARRGIELEAWRGATLIGDANATLDANGHAAFELTGSGRIQLKLQRVKNPAGGSNPAFRIDMNDHGAEPQSGAKGK